MWTIQIAGILVGNLKTIVFPKGRRYATYMGVGVLTVGIKKQLTLTQKGRLFNLSSFRSQAIFSLKISLEFAGSHLLICKKF